MSKANLFSNPALQKSKPSLPGFNLISQSNSFNAVFQTQPLEDVESKNIEKLLFENFEPERIEEEQVAKDLEEIKTITSEIKSIGKQGVILTGERVFKAREILKPYHDGTFTKWLASTFGTRKTGYNMLAYYEFYNALPNYELKENFKKIPQKAAYMLASREGDIELKAEIVREYHDLNHNDIINIIHERLPSSLNDKRSGKDSNTRLIASLIDTMKIIHRREKSLSEENRKDLEILKNMIDSLLPMNVKS